MNSSLRCCNHIKYFSNGVLAANSKGLQVVTVQKRGKADKGSSCCKEISQTAGKRVECWPKSDPQGWRGDCSLEPQPPNYDPYRIKVANVVVPPLPNSNAKPAGFAYVVKGDESVGPGQHPSGPQQQQQPQQKKEEEEDDDEEAPGTPSLYGYLKKLFRGKKGSGGSGTESFVPLI